MGIVVDSLLWGSYGNCGIFISMNGVIQDFIINRSK